MLINETKWQAADFASWSASGDAQHIVVVKQSYEFDSQGKLCPLSQAPDLQSGDEFNGEGAAQYLTAANELVPYKQGIEIYGNFTAYPPKGQAVRVIETQLQLSDGEGKTLLNKVLRVTGQRQWRRSLLGPVASEPAYLQPLTMTYDNAFGGQSSGSKAEFSAENPAGKGYKLSNRDAIGSPLPQIEYAHSQYRKPSHNALVAGYGPLPLHWAPRVNQLPKINEAKLMLGEFPYSKALADDFYNYAPRDQIVTAPFAPNWQLRLSGFVAELSYQHALTLKLPFEPPELSVHSGLQSIALDMKCDTLVVDTEAQRLSLIWRCGFARAQIKANSHIVLTQQGG
ncbi:DUF2169 domain-containing protein [Pseudoalteromonas fenneropenaei]|uniref:DUF2169 domain-containing protein n=1 Tax=Pseudoalteromonas fenneropenaei TaxID=1737459 RepID=A0ABV7CHS9_9GAMM